MLSATKWIVRAITLALLGGVTLHAAEDKALNLKVGQTAPSFEATDDQGKTWKSSDHIGKSVIVLYFYPADMTGGCTKQACG
ncbi:MAG TPA: redoxin domain-containing protein, partial [Gemmataceae bacterium]|nr:redoxin domain-containing protein [Gemmataceae bacterium]